MKYLSYISIFIAVLFIGRPNLYAGEPIGGVNISIDQIPGGKTFKTKTNSKGEFSFKNLPDGNYLLTVSYKGQSAVVGKKGSEKIVVFGGSNKSSGLPTGKRQHKPVTITKELDKSSPLLAKALCAGYNSSRSNKTRKKADHTILQDPTEQWQRKAITAPVLIKVQAAKAVLQVVA